MKDRELAHVCNQLLLLGGHDMKRAAALREGTFLLFLPSSHPLVALVAHSWEEENVACRAPASLSRLQNCGCGGEGQLLNKRARGSPAALGVLPGLPDPAGAAPRGPESP